MSYEQFINWIVHSFEVNISNVFQAEQVSFATVLDVLIIIVMAAIWALMPTDGIAIVTDWFYNKVMHVNIRISSSFYFKMYIHNYSLLLFTTFVS